MVEKIITDIDSLLFLWTMKKMFFSDHHKNWLDKFTSKQGITSLVLRLSTILKPT